MYSDKNFDTFSKINTYLLVHRTCRHGNQHQDSNCLEEDDDGIACRPTTR